jgi:hypothetical protein
VSRWGQGPGKGTTPLFSTGCERGDSNPHGLPHQILNLAGSGEYGDALVEMRERLRAWQIETLDLGFMPEGMALRLTRERGETPVEFADDESVYPIERILDTATLVGDPGAVDKLVERLGDANGVVRYWAAVGLDAARGAAPEEALRSALDDEVPEVRVVAAGALAALNGSPEAIDVLVDVLRSDDSQAVLMAARTLQLLGPRAEPARDAMAEVLERAADDSVYGIDALFIRFALNPALGTERGPSEVIEGPGRDMAPGSR